MKVWSKSIELTELVYVLTADFPKSELYGLTSQMRRAAISIASNIAEGSARNTRKDFKQFIAIARGSVCELLTQLVIASRLGFGSKLKIEATEALANEVSRMLSGLHDYLNSAELTTNN